MHNCSQPCQMLPRKQILFLSQNICKKTCTREPKNTCVSWRNLCVVSKNISQIFFLPTYKTLTMQGFTWRMLAFRKVLLCHARGWKNFSPMYSNVCICWLMRPVQKCFQKSNSLYCRIFPDWTPQPIIHTLLSLSLYLCFTHPVPAGFLCSILRYVGRPMVSVQSSQTHVTNSSGTDLLNTLPILISCFTLRLSSWSVSDTDNYFIAETTEVWSLQWELQSQALFTLHQFPICFFNSGFKDWLPVPSFSK